MIRFAQIVFTVGAMSLTGTALAQEFTVEGIYKHFRYAYSPKDVFLTAQRAALWVAENGNDGVKEFDKPRTQWNSTDGKQPQLAVANCTEEPGLVAHPNPKLHRVKAMKNIIKTFKDFDGRTYVLKSCNILAKQPKGAWTSTRQTWQRSETGLMDTITQLSIQVSVPGTTLSIQAHFPIELKTLGERQGTVDDLNALIDSWSIIPDTAYAAKP